MPRIAKAPATPLTTAQKLGTVIKSARNIMRKDKGLSGDLDRLPMLTWIMFLKFLDDLELAREHAAALGRKKYLPAIEAPYRWRDWAADSSGMTGDGLISFINNDEATRPDGKRGPGLFAYLKSLQTVNGAERREVIANIFSPLQNRMTSGYQLREVINKINEIHFNSTEEIHTLSHLYESMLREMFDAAGDAGEFYTPRAVVRFIVEAVNPRIGETVLDPACGSGGFLAEAYAHLEKQCRTVEQRRCLQTTSILGGEAKPLPYLLVQMNLLLHGLETPRIDPLNSLRHKLANLTDADRVDVILTNPPFGGEEEAGIAGNFPADRKTAETAHMFLMTIMRRLRRHPTPGRAAVVVPHGTLFGDGVCARIKGDLLKDFNLHTIVRLADGVFAPYTDIPTNILFFERGGPTKEIWYYQMPPPEGRKKYSKTQPMRFEEFAPVLEWMRAKKRVESEHAWSVPTADVLKYGEDGQLLSCNLDRKNPRAKDEAEHLPPDELLARIRGREQEIQTALAEIEGIIGQEAQDLQDGGTKTRGSHPATLSKKPSRKS